MEVVAGSYHPSNLIKSDSPMFEDTMEGMESVPTYPALTPQQLITDNETRKVSVPPHRMSPLRTNWMNIYTPIVTHLKLQIRMNTTTKKIELRTSEFTEEIGALQKAVDFLEAFMLGFSVEDAIALVRLDDLYVESFQIDDVKVLVGDNLSRAIGRIAGKDGRTKFTIENVTRTRIVLADKFTPTLTSHFRKIHILGSFSNIKIARDAICDLILGSPPGKVYAKLKIVSSRAKESI